MSARGGGGEMKDLASKKKHFKVKSASLIKHFNTFTSEFSFFNTKNASTRMFKLAVRFNSIFIHGGKSSVDLLVLKR